MRTLLYSNVNYALSETKNPVRTLKIAAPVALGSVAVMYMFVNVSPRSKNRTNHTAKS